MEAGGLEIKFKARQNFHFGSHKQKVGNSGEKPFQ